MSAKIITLTEYRMIPLEQLEDSLQIAASA